MKRFVFFIFLITAVIGDCMPQCFPPSTLFSSNINYSNAEANWNTTSGAHHYKIRYKEISSSTWLYKNNISNTLNTKLLNNLTPLSDYIWQIRTHCDSTNTNTSNWSITDTFTTFTNLCPNTTNLYTSNINYNNATANWDTISQADRYKIHYRELGSANWLNLAFIYNPNGSAFIPLLQQNTSYEWQIMTFYDTTNLLASLWSASDTFTTSIFVAAPFNPIVTNILGNVQCSLPTELSLYVSQSVDEPDIATSTITSDGGYFDIQSVSIGDSVGYAKMITSTQNIETVLRVGIIAGQNYAIINSYDSSGTLIGFFSIENTSSGIKVSSTSPNDGNNYTSGYTSEVHFTNLFVNPSSSGPLHFFIDIESELSDQITQTDTIQISCTPNSITELENSKKIIDIYNSLGKKCGLKKNTVLLLKLSNGEVRKRIFIEK